MSARTMRLGLSSCKWSVRLAVMAKAWLGAVAAIVLVLAHPGAAAEARGAAPTPVLGDWEGVATHGVPISFVLSRHGGGIRLHNLVVGLPAACVRPSTLWLARSFPRAAYVGPGGPPALRVIARRQSEIALIIHLSYSPIPLPIDGTLSSAHSAVLSMPLTGAVVSRCKWPRKLTWHVHPAHRTSIADGVWTGQLAAPGAANAALTIKVTAHGRIVDYFAIEVACSGGGSGSFSAGPGAGEFIAADGSFVGLGNNWRGQFGQDGTLRGTSFDPGACTGSSSVMSPFTATLTSP